MAPRIREDLILIEVIRGEFLFVTAHVRNCAQAPAVIAAARLVPLRCSYPPLRLGPVIEVHGAQISGL